MNRLCKNCKQEVTVEYSNCPHCGCRDLDITAQEQVTMKDRAHFTHRNAQGEVVQEQDVTDERGIIKDYSKDGKPFIKAQMKSPEVAEERKDRTIHSFVSAYNSLKRTLYSVQKLEEDRGLDGLATEPNGGKLKIQLTKAYVDGTKWKSLKQSGLVELGDLEQIWCQLKQAIEKKMRKHYADQGEMILLLDGEIIGLTKKDLEIFRAEHFSFLANTGFKEVWYRCDWEQPVRLDT